MTGFAATTRSRENVPRTSRGRRFVATMFPLSRENGRPRRRSPAPRSRFARDRPRRRLARSSVPFRHEILSNHEHQRAGSPERSSRSGDPIVRPHHIRHERSVNIWTLPIRRPPVRGFLDCLTRHVTTRRRRLVSHRIRRLTLPKRDESLASADDPTSGPASDRTHTLEIRCVHAHRPQSLERTRQEHLEFGDSSPSRSRFRRNVKAIDHRLPSLCDAGETACRRAAGRP